MLVIAVARLGLRAVLDDGTGEAGTGCTSHCGVGVKWLVRCRKESSNETMENSTGEWGYYIDFVV